MAIWALAGTLAFSFLLELIGASAANQDPPCCCAAGLFLFYALRSDSRVRRALRNWWEKRMEVKVTARVSATGSAR